MLTGCIYKRFIRNIISNQRPTLDELGIKTNGKIISFFDESFGNEYKMTGEHYVTFWETALKLARIDIHNTVVLKPKELARSNNLSPDLKKRFIEIKNRLEKLPNVYIIDSNKWSFIEAIGISNIVVTQGMTTAATIAIICGTQGLYLDQAHYAHPFAEAFKDTIVFDDPDKLISMIQKILEGRADPLKGIPENTLRAFDEYPDDRGIDLFRSVLVGDFKKSVGIIVQARMGSTRLPGKAMKTILGRPMLEILIERLRRSRLADTIIIATSKNRDNDVIEVLANNMGISCFRGDEEDVLDRYYQAAKKYNLDVIVRVTSDCPLSDPLLIDELVKFYFDNLPVEYVANTMKRTYPRGFDIEVFGFESLRKAAQEAANPYQREHVTPFIHENMKTLNYANASDTSRYRVTVDTIEDLELVSCIYELLRENKEFGYRQVIDLLNSRPDLAAINQGIAQKR
jgi:spore coat polysaccharide biosynthesis protein SpsF